MLFPLVEDPLQAFGVSVHRSPVNGEVALLILGVEDFFSSASLFSLFKDLIERIRISTHALRTNIHECKLVNFHNVVLL